MSSQAGNLQDLNSYSNLRTGPSFIIGSDPDHSENNSSRQEQQQQFANHPAGPSEMGLGFMTNLESSDDSRCAYFLRDLNSSPLVCFFAWLCWVDARFISLSECWASKFPLRACETQPTLPTFHANHQRLLRQKPRATAACIISTGGKESMVGR